jgi:alkylation response protein AidB-like acyl-CoA dehydrogenase
LVEVARAAIESAQDLRRRPVDAHRADEWCALVWTSTSARLIGVAQRAAALAREHLLTRTQFGRPLASFQVLQHQAVDRHGEIAAAQALLDRVLEHWTDTGVRRGAVHALKAHAARTAVASAKTSVQHMGAMGFSHEGDAGLCLRHAITLAARHGDELDHRRAFAGAKLAFLD